MQFGVCNIGVVPIRLDKSNKSEMISQLFYGEVFKVLKSQKKWSYIHVFSDDYQGWIDNKQFKDISKDAYKKLTSKNLEISLNLLDIISDKKDKIPVPMGSIISAKEVLNHHFDAEFIVSKKNKENIVQTALTFLNAPYLWGGKTLLGIDCSGFVQVVYRVNGYWLKRDAKDQSKEGESLSFLEESTSGDLAFFNNEEGEIIHVGILMGNNNIIHAHGRVRIDKIDSMGIFNKDIGAYSHKLRVIKRIL